MFVLAQMVLLERKLAAILAADAVGYSRLMGQNEVGTYEQLRAHRKELFEPEIERHHGRVFKLTGDGLLAEFASVVEAVECAAALQRGMAQRNSGVPGDQRIDVRIGLHVGDVILEDTDRHGDAVNVAARLQQLADPGGICVSGNVYDQVRTKVPLAFELLGRQTLKNIAEPVPVYRVVLAPVHRRKSPARPLNKRKALWAGALAATALLVMGLGWYLLTPNRALANKPAIAVLPLETIGGDETVSRLAQGVTEDTITDLARFRDLDVIASNSSRIYQGQAIDVRKVGRELNVGYVLKGTIQQQTDQVRITAQLVDTATGATLWSQRWDRPLADMFAVQAEVAEQVAGTLGSVSGINSIGAEEIRRLKTRPPANLSAYEHYLLALDGRAKFTKEGIFGGIEEATKAIEIDANFARAYAIRGRLTYNTIHYGVNYDTAIHGMEADVNRAVELAPDDPDSRSAIAWYLTLVGRVPESVQEIRTALQANPANVEVLYIAAAILAPTDHPDEAGQLADKVLRLDPNATAATLNTLKDAYFFSRQFEKLINVVSRIPADARSRGSSMFLAMSYAFLGQDEQAERASKEFREKYPNLSAELLLNQDWIFAYSEPEKLFIEGFRRAKLPLCASPEEIAKIAKPKRLPDCTSKAPNN